MSTQTVIIKGGGSYSNKKPKTVSIPSDTALIAASQELRILGKQTQPAAGQYGNCIGIYLPPRKYTTQSIDPFTGASGEIEGGGTIQETCRFWFGSEALVAEAMYERNPVEIYYYCTKTDGTQSELYEDTHQVEVMEGAARIIERSEYERNPKLRELCLKKHGSCCVICGFDFEKTYGGRAKGFIHVHHLTPLSQVRTAYVVDPKTDLIPVCPNCHAVIHLKCPPYSPDEVREMTEKK